MAESDGLDIGISLHIAREHCHRVRIVQKRDTGAYLCHILGKILHYGNGTERAEDAAYAEGVGDGLTETVFLRDLEVGDGARLVAADLNGVDSEVSTAERVLSVRNSEIFCYSRLAAVNIFILDFPKYSPFSCKIFSQERSNASTADSTLSLFQSEKLSKLSGDKCN